MSKAGGFADVFRCFKEGAFRADVGAVFAGGASVVRGRTSAQQLWCERLRKSLPD